MEFITNIPDDYGTVMAAVRKLSKLPAYILTYISVKITYTADLFFLNIIKYYSLPRIIISDRDPKFTATIWQSLMK